MRARGLSDERRTRVNSGPAEVLHGLGVSVCAQGRFAMRRRGQVSWREVRDFGILPLGLGNYSRLDIETKDKGLLVFGFPGVGK
jgi:hypothetical protein